MKFPIILLTSLFACVLASAQVPEGYVQVDSLVYVPLAAVDTSLNHKYIGSVLPEDVNVIQSAETETALRQHILSNESKTVGCYRIRIFFDNKQNSREVSEETLRRFRSLHPGVSAYRSFQNPFFKVTVGDYRSKSEALSAMETFRREFPAAFIVREQVRFPSIGNQESWRVDTVKIFKPLEVL